jgi:hypothetical protein
LVASTASQFRRLATRKLHDELGFACEVPGLGEAYEL